MVDNIGEIEKTNLVAGGIGNYVISGSLVKVENNIISPAQITSNQNDYAPTGIATASILRLNTDASRNITSITTGSSGRVIIIHNVGSFNIVIKDDDGSTGTAANRFALNADITLLPDQSAIFQYDSTTSRWRAFGATPSAAGAGDMVLASSQTVSGAKTFLDQTLKLRNPANTFSYTLVHGAIAADRNLNVPVITGTDTIATLSLAQTFTVPKTFDDYTDHKVISAPADPSAGYGRAYMKQIDSNNDGLFIKMKKNGSITEVQIA